jgi:predicted AlkP superfamily pyrophosphatase or phosphodiesterase
MQNYIIYLLLFVVTNSFAQPRPKVVFIIADGIPADVIERLQPPAMQQIIRKGKYSRAYVGGVKGTYKETPTISAPGYNNLLTGVWGYKHNVWDNDNQQPNYNYPTIFKLLKTQPKPLTSAIFSTWIDNRTVLLGEGLPQTGQLKVDYIFDGYEKDTLRFPHDKASLYIHQIDEQVVQAADSVIRQSAPDLSWIYLEYTDDIGHKTGTGKAFDSAVVLLDHQIEKISTALDYREKNHNEKWLMVITTDHGRDAIEGHHHGGQSDRERTTWMILNKPITNHYWANNRPAIVDIYPSIAKFLGLDLPGSVKAELDGTPFIGELSVSNAAMQLKGDTLQVEWTPYHQKDPVKISIAYANKAKTGGNDQYQVLETLPAGARKFSTVLPGLGQQPFFKIIIEGRLNTLNCQHSRAK